MKKLLVGIFLAVVVDFYFFPVSFTFIPVAVNSKMMVALFGMAAFVYKSIQERSMQLSRRTLIAGLLAVVFSLWCFFSVTENGGGNMEYVSYWTSFLTWMGGAYGVYVILKHWHGKVDLALITKYLAIVCLSQCVIALMIDNIPAVKTIVQQIFAQGYDFYERVGRLYGIGCALDPAGIRFAAVLVMIAHQMVMNKDVKSDLRSTAGYLAAFILITVIGSMIARTTTTGALLAIAYTLFSYSAIKRGGYITGRQVGFFALLIALVVIAVAAATSLYNANPEARSYLRFAFEGFFNWVETGEFRTNSTDILMEVMWVWPDNFHDWMIGTGRIGVFEWNTDIGYCNFTLYCGLVGLAIFASYFIYVNLSLIGKFRNFQLVALLLITLQGIVWAKVMTDIFLLDALLLCIDGDLMPDSPESLPETEEALS